MKPCECGCNCGKCKRKDCECECHDLDDKSTALIKEVAGKYILIPSKMSRVELICAIRDSKKAMRVIKKVKKKHKKHAACAVRC